MSMKNIIPAPIMHAYSIVKWYFFQLFTTFKEMGDVYLLILNLKAISFTN